MSIIPPPSLPSDDARAVLLNAMSALQGEFVKAEDDVEAREANLHLALNNIQNILMPGIGKTVLNNDNFLAKFTKDFDVDLDSLSRTWLGRVEKYDRNTEFRRGFTDCLVIYVLGKVKAGKSSLGNYVAYGRSNPVGQTLSDIQPNFFTAAMTQGLDNQVESAAGTRGFFRVGERETTKSIQGFRFPGMTWVDSPGLHSVTPENGALASDYADVADLIIYPMHTGNPGRVGDIAELQYLIRGKKPFLVLITQCDTPEDDEAADGSIVQTWVMKDKSRRDGQVDHVRRAMTDVSNTTSLDILSLSVRFAEAHENTPAALEESGVAEFFRLLTNIASSEGLIHKRETPSRNLNHFVDLVLDGDEQSNFLSVSRVFAQLDKLDKNLTKAAKDLERRRQRAVACVISRIIDIVSTLIKKHADDQNQQGFNEDCEKELRKIVSEESLSAVNSFLGNASGGLMANAPPGIIENSIPFKHLEIRISKSNRKTFGAAGNAVGGIGGLWAGAELGAIAGSVVPGIGTVIGGIVGGFVGGLAGNFAGNALGEKLGSDWEESMRSGDNRAEVESSAVAALQKAGIAAVDGFFANIQNAAITPLERRAKEIRSALEDFSTILKTKVRSDA